MRLKLIISLVSTIILALQCASDRFMRRPICIYSVYQSGQYTGDAEKSGELDETPLAGGFYCPGTHYSEGFKFVYKDKRFD